MTGLIGSTALFWCPSSCAPPLTWHSALQLFLYCMCLNLSLEYLWKKIRSDAFELLKHQVLTYDGRGV